MIENDNIPLPTASELGAYLTKDLFKARFSILVHSRKFNEKPTPEKKAFTKFFSDVAKHPYLLRFSQVDGSLSHTDTLRKKNAIDKVKIVVYHVLWHARMIFPSVEQKGVNQPMTVKANDCDHNPDIYAKLYHEISEGIRRLSASYKTCQRNKLKKLQQGEEVVHISNI